MKKIQLKGKLTLNKETIAKLNDEQMGNIKGGAGVLSDNNTPCGSDDETCISGCEPVSCRWCDPC